MPLRVEPDHIYFPILVGENVDPDNVTSPGTKPEVQKSKAATHLRPVAAVHSVVPQAQSMAFALLPSVVVQDESCALTKFDNDVRCKKIRNRSVA